MKVLGLHTMLHDSGASVIIDDKVNSILEARLTRVKHTGSFPYLSIQYVMNIHGLKNINEFDIVAVDHLMQNQQGTIEKEIREMGFRGDIQFVGHHDAHAASAFFCSPFEEAAILVVDGQGSSDDSTDAHELQSYYYGKANTLTISRKTLSTDSYRHGIGDFYSAVTTYLNFGVEHGKVMGLASYGGHADWSKNIVIRNQEGDYYLDAYGWVYNPTDLGNLYFSGNKPRTVEPALDRFWADVAYVAQNNCEYALIEMARDLYKRTLSRNICLAGGVALNSVANKKVLDETAFENIFIQPAASDEGISLGAALYAYHVIGGKPRFFEMRNAFLGAEYSDDDIQAALKDKKHLVKVRRSDDIYSETARLLQHKKIVGWFQGASEVGPRALGHRSILCDPRSVEMRDYLNAQVKKREMFRPFAPAVLDSYCKDYFYLNCDSPFMLLVARVKEVTKQKAPAIVHIDGTARIQTVSRKENPCFYKLIQSFYDQTGLPMLLNTSFNIAGEPIVESPRDALNCFINSKMDALVLHDYILTKYD